MHDSSTFQLILEEGRLEGEQELLTSLGEDRFGPPDAATVAALTAIKDSARLKRIGKAIFTAASWQELLATP